MKTLSNQTLIYDEDCPMCNLYTSGFIKAKMLDSNGRKSFTKLSVEEQNSIDFDRAKNEIALVDRINKTTLYGIESLLKIMGYSFPWMEKVGNLKPINYILKKLYKFISYNRKVIAPSKIKNENSFQCIPYFNLKYRVIYILFATLFTSVVLYQYSKSIMFLPEATFSRELILAVGQIGFQYLFIQKLSKEKQLNYIGNLVTISIMGCLFLLPMIFLNQFIILNNYVVLGWFGLTVNLMILEHSRRVNILELPKYLTLTWILYRIVALIIILNF